LPGKIPFDGLITHDPLPSPGRQRGGNLRPKGDRFTDWLSKSIARNHPAGKIPHPSNPHSKLFVPKLIFPKTRLSLASASIQSRNIPFLDLASNYPCPKQIKRSVRVTIHAADEDPTWKLSKSRLALLSIPLGFSLSFPAFVRFLFYLALFLHWRKIVFRCYDAFACF